LPVPLSALVFVFIFVFFLFSFLLPGLSLSDTLLLEADCTVAIDRTGIAVPTAPFFGNFTLDNIKACCVAPTRTDVASNAEAIVEEETTDAADSICVGRW